MLLTSHPHLRIRHHLTERVLTIIPTIRVLESDTKLKPTWKNHLEMIISYTPRHYTAYIISGWLLSGMTCHSLTYTQTSSVEDIYF